MTTAPVRRGAALVALVVAALATTACTPPVAEPRQPDPSSSTQEAPMSDDPSEVLALAGLELPDDATDVTVDGTDVPGYHYAYTVTFTAPRESMDRFALEAFDRSLDDLSRIPAGDPGPLLRDTSVTRVPEGSRSADRSFEPADGYGNLVLVVEGPDLTTAHVGVASFPS